MKIAIGVGVNGLRLNNYALAELFKRHPEYFDSFDHATFLFTDDAHLTGQDACNKLMEIYSSQAVADHNKIYFLNDGAQVRTNKWLIEQIEQDPVRVIEMGYEDTAKIVDIPDGIQWYMHASEDGSESIHEHHRVWS